MSARPDPKEKAQALRQRLNLGSGYVDVFEVLRDLGIEVYRHAFPEDRLEGALTVRDNIPFSFVNSQGALTRQRLTAAHELGHYELGAREEGTQVLEGAISADGDPEEWSAFRFARHFLMDEQGVRHLVSDIEDGNQRIAAVASHFMVSPRVAAIHLEDLKLIKRGMAAGLKDAFDKGIVTASGFLSLHGYRMSDLWDSQTELDAGHVRRAINAYMEERLSLASLAESLMCSQDEAIRRLQEAGIPVRDESEEADEARSLAAPGPSGCSAAPGR